MYCPHCMKTIDDNVGYCPICHKSTSVKNAENALPIGSILANRYYVGVMLGQGGFGITYVGCDTRLNKKIAIKEYYPAGYVNRLSEHSMALSVNQGDTAVAFEHEKQKFIKEAYLLAEFAGDHNVVSVTDIISEHNTAYIVMEYVEGKTLEQYLREVDRMSFDEAFSMLEPIMDSLSRIHTKGLMHRDISPANIMVEPGNHPILIDFGAAREFEGAAEKSISVILKQGYAPTEQYQTRGLQGPWTDVYAICATIYKMITGITPPSAIDRVIGDTMKRPAELGAVIDSQKEAVLLKGLAINQADRFSSIQDLKNAFNGMVIPQKEEAAPASYESTVLLTPSGKELLKENKAAPVQEESPEQAQQESHGEKEEHSNKTIMMDEKPKKRKGLLIAGIVAIIAVIGIVAGIVISQNSFSSTVTEATVADGEVVYGENYSANVGSGVKLVINEKLTDYSNNQTVFNNPASPILHVMSDYSHTIDIIYTYENSTDTKSEDQYGITLKEGVPLSTPVSFSWLYSGDITITIKDQYYQRELATKTIHIN